ncbi:Eae protein [Salmonella enterica subsp. arizonae]|nr:Eae protein [Salmonella enterica subsp. arizonae]
MQEVKIYTASPSDLSPPVQSESFCVDMVLASDYAALEARCAALASENALARNAVQAFCDVIGDNTEVISEEVGRDGVLVILEAMKATGNMPSTEAFLAEVGAQGVERYAAQLKSEAELADETGWDGAAKFLISESEKVLAFAAQIRQEAAK